ncbi:MAG: hypothetical protein ACW96U_11085 [Candidatus Heimdallarchaeaceae archaeon]
MHLLLDLSKKHKKTLVYVTHDTEQAMLASRQLIMNDGTIIKDFSNSKK